MQTSLKYDVPQTHKCTKLFLLFRLFLSKDENLSHVKIRFLLSKKKIIHMEWVSLEECFEWVNEKDKRTLHGLDKITSSRTEKNSFLKMESLTTSLSKDGALQDLLWRKRHQTKCFMVDNE